MDAFEEVEALFHRGTQAMEAGDFETATGLLRQALTKVPELAEAHLNLGFSLERQGHLTEAESHYFSALALDPDCEESYVNLGALQVNQKRFKEAEELYAFGLQGFPRSPALWTNLGALHTCLQREDEAEHCFRTALELNPAHPKARFNLSYLLLRQGRFEEGWQAVEARARNLAMMAHSPASRWRGESLVGKSLLIPIEAGFGDLIQYARFVPVLKERGARRIGFVCHSPLVRLFETLTGLDEVIPLNGALSEADWDHWILPFSIPGVCRVRLESIPTPIPYLHGRPEELENWGKRLPQGGLRVGLAWRGNPAFENDGDRSLPLELLQPLGLVEGLSLVSLQKGRGEDEARHPPTGMELFDAAPWLQDFGDTAALLGNLDLLITVDTAVAHLAGALGRPCWTLLPAYKTDARWLKDREDSPWYPSMRLFRQRTPGEWKPLIETLTQALRAWASVVHIS